MSIAERADAVADDAVFEDSATHPFNDLRRSRYAAAEAICPLARLAELETFSRYLPEGAGRPLLELGSGNGTLTKHLLARGWRIDTVDVSFSPIDGAERHFAHDLSLGLPDLRPEVPYAAVASLATLHHVVAQPDRLPEPLARGLANVTAKGATLVLQDVPAPGSLARRGDAPGAREARSTAEFFAAAVDPYSRPRHFAQYLEMDAIAKQLEGHGFRREAVFWHDCSWRFSSYAELAVYVAALFNLETDSDTIDGLLAGRYEADDGGVRLLWGLDCLVMRRI